MADEQTQSKITWLNSPYQSQQQVGTLQDHVEAIPMYIEELLLLLTCYVEGTT